MSQVISHNRMESLEKQQGSPAIISGLLDSYA